MCYLEWKILLALLLACITSGFQASEVLLELQLTVGSHLCGNIY